MRNIAIKRIGSIGSTFLILTFVLSVRSDACFIPKLTFGHQILPISFKKKAMAYGHGMEFSFILNEKWAVETGLYIQYYWSRTKNPYYPRLEPSEFIIEVRDWLLYFGTNHILRDLNNTKVCAGANIGLLGMKRINNITVIWFSGPYKEEDFGPFIGLF